MLNLLFLDVEWANPTNKSLCQICLYGEDYENGTVFVNESIYINPEDFFSKHCIDVHHITFDKVYDKENFEKFWNKYGALFSTSVIVGHNVVNADLDAITKNLSRYDIAVPEMYYIDTLKLSKRLLYPELEKFNLKYLCERFNISCDNYHDARYDVGMTRSLFYKLINSYHINPIDLVEKYASQEINDLFLSKSVSNKVDNMQLRKELNFLLGYIGGLSIDSEIDDNEKELLIDYIDKNYSFKYLSSMRDINLAINDLISDEVLQITKVNKLKSKLDNKINSIDAKKETSDTQYLKTLIEGINSDNEISEKEVFGLKEWVDSHQDLKGHYPYNKIATLLEKILIDNVISECEKEELSVLFDEIINPYTSDDYSIEFDGKCFCLSGDFKYGSKKDVEKILTRNGAIIHSSVKKSTDYVVVGHHKSASYSNGSYGTKVVKAMEMNISVIEEDEMFLILNTKEL